MLELLFVLALAAGCTWVAISSFVRPKGVFLRCLIGVCLSIGAAAALWSAVGPFISNEAGLGAFFLFCVVAVFSVGVGVIACAAASARYVLDATASRRS